MTPAFVPPISVVLARDKDRYLKGLTLFREDGLADWIERFAAATAEAAMLAVHYTVRVGELQDQWRERLRQHANPRADAAAWTLITALPAHPIITVPVAVAATGRTKPAVANAIEQMEAAGILVRLTQSARNRAWEAEGLLDLMGIERPRSSGRLEFAFAFGVTNRSAGDGKMDSMGDAPLAAARRRSRAGHGVGRLPAVPIGESTMALGALDRELRAVRCCCGAPLHGKPMPRMPVATLPPCLHLRPQRATLVERGHPWWLAASARGLGDRACASPGVRSRPLARRGAAGEQGRRPLAPDLPAAGGARRAGQSASWGRIAAAASGERRLPRVHAPIGRRR